LPKLVILKERFDLLGFNASIYYRVFNKPTENIKSIKAKVIKYINLK
jgi:hypothetical protein